MKPVTIIPVLLIIMTAGTYIGINYLNLPQYFWIFPLNGLLLFAVAYIAKNRKNEN